MPLKNMAYQNPSMMINLHADENTKLLKARQTEYFCNLTNMNELHWN